ncbi:MAG: hypothetical protein HYZ47_05245 [Simkania negevensis]|nr:hypothetical protein [Simkania negevensis]
MSQPLAAICKYSPKIIGEVPYTAIPIGLSLGGLVILTEVLKVKKLNFKHAFLTTSSIFITKYVFHAIFAIGYMGYKEEEKIKSCEVVRISSVMATLVAALVVWPLASRFNFHLDTRRWVAGPLLCASLFCHSPLVRSLHECH